MASHGHFPFSLSLFPLEIDLHRKGVSKLPLYSPAAFLGQDELDGLQFFSR